MRYMILALTAVALAAGCMNSPDKVPPYELFRWFTNPDAYKPEDGNAREMALRAMLDRHIVRPGIMMTDILRMLGTANREGAGREGPTWHYDEIKDSEFSVEFDRELSVKRLVWNHLSGQPEVWE